MDGGEKVSGGLVVARCNCPILLELAVEVFHEVACLVHLFVESTRELAVAFGWDDRGFACRDQRFNHAFVRIEGSPLCLAWYRLLLRWQQLVGAFQVMGLARGQEECNRIAQGVDHGVDFGA